MHFFLGPLRVKYNVFYQGWNSEIANREDPDQTLLQEQSDRGLCCLIRPIWQATSVRNFRI